MVDRVGRVDLPPLRGGMARGADAVIRDLSLALALGLVCWALIAGVVLAMWP
jgi:hypothetical protein